MRNWKFVVLCVLMFATAALPQRISGSLDDVRDQVMINTARLDSLERSVQMMQNSMAITAERNSVIYSDLAVLKNQAIQIQSTLSWILAFIATNLVGLAGLGLRYYIDKRRRDS